MPKDKKAASSSGTSVDPVGAWRQWYDNAANMWSNTLGDSKEAYLDPFGVNRQWLKSAEEHGEPPAPPSVDPAKLWQDWSDATASMWRNAAGAGTADPLGLTKQWLEMIDETRAKMLSKEGLALDPLNFLREWYDRASETWSTVMGTAIGTEALIESASRYLEVYTSYYKSLRQTAETQLHNLQIPTRTDVARVAGLVVALEDKVDRLDEAFERFEYGGTQTESKEATAALIALEERVVRIEHKVDTLLAVVEQLSSNRNVAAELPAPAQTQASPANGSKPARRTPRTGARRTPNRPVDE